MARKPLRSQLNQIRAWVRQGRTDAWIAHQLDIPASELREFRRRHELAPEEEAGDLELRDEIEAEIEAATAEEAAREDEDDEDAAEEGAADEDGDDGETDDGEGAGAGGGERPRRRRRRGRRGRGRRKELEATFDHGDSDGYGLWLDPAVKDDPVYSEHWAGQREVTVRIDQDQIVIRRVTAEPVGSDEDED
jgi:hypothetical protein